MNSFADEIYGKYQQRVSAAYGPNGQGLHDRMRRISEIYNDRATVQLPEINGIQSPPIPNLIATGVDQLAGRVASVMPQVTFLASKDNRASLRKANTAAQSVGAWWQADNLPIKLRNRARHLIAYGISPVTIRWNFNENRPTWSIRDPLSCYPSMDVEPGSFAPAEVFYGYRRSIAWLQRAGYAEQVATLIGNRRAVGTTPLLVIESVTPDRCVHILAGGQDPYGQDMIGAPTMENGGTGRTAVLEDYSTPAMTSFVPSRIGLDGTMGQFDSSVSIYHLQARLATLEAIAVEKGIFPDTVLVSRPNELAKVVDGWYDGRSGQINVVAGGDIKELTTQPGYLTAPSIDRLERNQRVSAGIPAEMGGESSSNIRTGRRGDAVMSAAIDVPITEAQQVLAASLREEDKTAIALAKQFDGNASRTFYLGAGNGTRAITFVANNVFDNAEHSVSYPAVGSDANSLLMGLQQRVGAGLMSKRTAQQLDPFIASPEVERDQGIVEGLEQALLAGIQQQAASGQLPPQVLGKIMTLVSSDQMELAEAITKVTEEAAAMAQAQQAQQAQQGQPGQPGPPSADQLAAPAAMQALAGGQPPTTIPGNAQGTADLAGMLRQLRTMPHGQSPTLREGTM